MATESKIPAAPGAVEVPQHHELGIRIFTYPKVIFIFPTLIVAVICAIGMKIIESRHGGAIPQPKTTSAVAPAQPKTTTTTTPGTTTTSTRPAPAEEDAPLLKRERFLTAQNLMGVLFLGVFAFNLLIMAIDFPRFSVFGLGIFLLLVLFVLLWIGAAFEFEMLGFLRDVFGHIYVYANSGFYLMVTIILSVLFIIIYLTRWLDYWKILPNEILHHHGPWSDLERFPTMNLKFDKEIPDVFELLILGAGRLVLHVTEERKAIVLDNVLWISQKERALKQLMSRLEVRITTDQEVADS